MKIKKTICFVVAISIVLSIVPFMRTFAKTSETIWKEDFENGIAGWRFFDGDNDSDTWSLFNAQDSGYEAHSGSFLLASRSANRTPDNYAVSPAIEISNKKISDKDILTISWYRKALNSYAFNEHYTVYVYSGSDDFLRIDDVKPELEKVYSETIKNGGKYEQVCIDFSAYRGKTIRLVFRHHDCTDLHALMLDDISIDASYSNSSQTFYGFEDDVSEWSFVDADGDKSTWSVTSSYSYGGQKSLISYSYRWVKYNPQNYAISPAIAVSGDYRLQLDWYAGSSSSDAYAETYDVYIYTGSEKLTANNIVSALAGVKKHTYTLTTNEFMRETIDLDEYTGCDSIRIIFYHYIPEGGLAQSDLLIDNVTVTGVAKPSHSATFLVDGAAYGDVNSYAEGEQIVAPADPSKTGYTFTGWDPAVGTMGNADMTFNAKFEAKTYNVKFMNGEVQHDANTVKYDGAYTLPAAPTKDGYTFAGWVDAEGNAMPATHTTDGDVTFYAKWATSAFDAKFYLDAAKTALYDTKSVEFGAAITAPAAPSKTGYTFKGWSLDGSTVLADLGTMDTEGKDFIAVFEENAALVSFFDGETQIGEQKKMNWGEKISVPSVPKKDGFEFVGWFDAEDNEMPETVPEVAEVKYFAKYNAEKYTVTFEADGETVRSEEALYGSTIVPPADPSKVGNTFKGWAVEGTTDIVTFDDNTTVPVGSVTYVAIFEVNTYKITYYVDNEFVQTIEVKYGDSIPKYNNPDVKKWSEVPETMPAEDISIYGSTSEENYTVTFTVNGVIYAEVPNNVGLPIKAPDYKVPDGHSFSGWDLPKLMPAENIALDATLTKNSYSVKYYLFEGDTETYAEFIVPYDDVIPIPEETPNKDNYVFVGWDNGELTKMPAKDIDIYAIFTPILYTVRFCDESGKEISSSSVEFGNTIESGTANDKVGYTFKGWMLSKDGTEKDIVEFPCEVKSELSFYPLYLINSYTISFDSKGGTPVKSITLNYGEKVSGPVVPTKEGHSFDGWYLNGGKYEFGTMPAEDINLIAEWTPNKYDATFYKDGVLIKTVPTLFGQVPVAPTEGLEKVGYTFTGWNPALTAIGVDGARYDAMYVAQNVDYKVNVYTMGLDGNYGEPEVLSYTATADSSVTYPAAEKTGFTIADNSVLSGAVTPDGSLVLSVYYSRNKYTFKTVVDRVVTSVTYYYGAEIKAPADPVKEGYTFSQWSSDIPKTMPARDVTVTASFSINKCTIIFNSNGGTSVESVSVGYGTYVAVPTTPTKVGYIFDGWFNGETKVEFPIKSLKEDLKLTADWIPAPNKYTIEVYRMNTEGVYELEASKVYEDKKTDDEVNVAKYYPAIASGFKLDTEKTDKEGTVAANGGSVFKIYIARNQYKLTFVSDGKQVKQESVYFGAAISEPERPVKTGYVFKYWWSDSESKPALFPTAMPANNLTYTAKFVQPQISIKGFTENKYVDYRTTITFKAVVADKPAVGEIRWYINGVYSGSGEKYTMTEVKANFTVQAKFETSKEILSMTEIETVNVNTGFFAKLVAFFKGLFGKLPSGTQGEDI